MYKWPMKHAWHAQARGSVHAATLEIYQKEGMVSRAFCFFSSWVVRKIVQIVEIWKKVPLFGKKRPRNFLPPAAPSLPHHNGLGDGGTAALNAIRTGEGDKDSLDSRKACNMGDLDVGGGDCSSSAFHSRAKLRKMFHDGAVGDDLLSKNTMVLPCHGSDINLSCNDLQLEYVKPVINNVNGSVIIPADVVNRGSLPYSRTLYGYFIEEKEIDFSLVEYHICNMWKTHGIEDVMENHKGFYFFKFKTDEGMLLALENGPWTINNIPIFFKRWTPGLVLDKSKHDKLKLPVWIRIYDISLELWNKEGLNIIASMLGNPLAVDTCTARMCMKASGRAGYARILVDFEATGNWVDEISVSIPYGNGYSLSTLRVEYSWKPGNSFFCKVFDQTHTDSSCIPQKVLAKNKDNELNEIRLKKEEEEREVKRRYKAQPHLYTIIKVARDEDMLEQIGKDIYFDLVDHNKVCSFYIKKQTPFKLFKEEVAKEFGVPVQFQRFWIWAKRQNDTYRANRPLTAQEETQSVSKKNHNAELKLFLEIETGPDLYYLPPPDKSKQDILVFVKLYDPEKEELRYVGRFFVKSCGKPTEIISKLNERAGFSPDEEIELYEEIRSEPCVMCERLDIEKSFRYSEIEDGDIICFQKPSHAQDMDKYRYPDVPSFLEYVKKRQELKIQCLKTLKISFHHSTKEEPVIHNIRLPKQSTVGDVLNEIKTKVV
ncbi:unnamed protein product [Lactuca virosa]|uniref:Ubiquitin carboxyl-terminal hydrolase 7 ICP0-binding domain-containing protein n=1 Tax=Lactuca virosa TaxID=75947 RepID=A0AAU9NJZ9_9ASTR|nr:unnamed protein product [Lactuca virosa]